MKIIPQLVLGFQHQQTLPIGISTTEVPLLSKEGS